MTFDFNVLPAITTSLGPPGISFSLAPDMTAGNTPFAPFTPPTPGVVQPGGGLPIPAALSAPAVSPLAVSDPAPAGRVEGSETPMPEASRMSASTPTVVIPGVNGAPLAKTPTGTSGAGTSGVAGSAPFTPVTDALNNGIGAFTNGVGAFANEIGAVTGTRPKTASGTESTGTDGSGEG
jgi:hypothetical protein